jgi:hypothetical protein
VLRAALPLLACVLLLAACGEQPDDPPRVFQVKQPEGQKQADFPGVGMAFQHPANWKLRRRDEPGVFELVSGQVIVAGWAYPREEPLPESEAELEGAKDRLVEAIEVRDPDYRVRSAAVTEVAGAPAIDVEGEQTLSRRDLRTRSVHVFTGDVEYVIEAIAPPEDYDLVERRVMDTLLDSLELEGEVAEATG